MIRLRPLPSSACAVVLGLTGPLAPPVCDLLAAQDTAVAVSAAEGAPRAGVLVGRVVTEAGEPVPDARLVQVPTPVPQRGEPGFQELLNGLEEVAAAGDGTFELPVLGSGHGALLASAPGRGWSLTWFSGAAGGDAPIDLGAVIVPLERTVEGRVVDGEGAPLASVELRASSSNSFAPFVPGRVPADLVTSTGADGGFRFGELDITETLTLTATKPGFVPRAALGHTGAQPAPLEIVLRAAASLSGRVVDPGGTPVSGAVVLSVSRDPRSHFAAVTTAEDGAFEVPAAPPGRLVLAAEAPGFVRSRPHVAQVAAGQGEEHIFLRLESPVTFAGRLLDGEGAPIAGALVRTDPGWHGGVRTDTAGSFAIDGLAEGIVELEIEIDNRPPVAHAVHVSSHSTREEVRLALGELRGRLLRPDGSSAAGVPFTLESAGGPSRSERRTYGVTGPDGAFFFDRMPPGVYRVRLARDRGGWLWDGWPLEALIEVEESSRSGASPVTEVEARLPPLIPVRVRLTGALAEDLAREDLASFEALLGDGELGTQTVMRLGETLPDGTHRLAELPPGTWFLLAAVGTRDAGAVTWLQVESGKDELVIDLELRPGREMPAALDAVGEPPSP